MTNIKYNKPRKNSILFLNICIFLSMKHLKCYNSNIDCAHALYESGVASGIPFIFHAHSSDRVYYSGLDTNGYSTPMTDYILLEYIENTNDAYVSCAISWKNYYSVELDWEQTEINNNNVIRNDVFYIINNRYTSNNVLQDFTSINLMDESSNQILLQKLYMPTNLYKMKYICNPSFTNQMSGKFSKYNVKAITHDGEVLCNGSYNIDTDLNYSCDFINLFWYHNINKAKARFYKAKFSDYDYQFLKTKLFSDGYTDIYLYPAINISTDEIGIFVKKISIKNQQILFTLYNFYPSTGSGMIAGPPVQPTIG